MPVLHDAVQSTDGGVSWRAKLDDGTPVVVRRLDGVEPDAYGAVKERLRAAGSATHPNLERVFGAAESQSHLWVICEAPRGLQLERLLKIVSPLSPPQVTALGLAVLGALEALHRRGFVHGSLTPAAVHVLPDGQIKVGGFATNAVHAPEANDRVADVRAAGALICACLGIPSVWSPSDPLREPERAAPALAATARAIAGGSLVTDAAAALVAFQDSAGLMASTGAQAASLSELGGMAGGAIPTAPSRRDNGHEPEPILVTTRPPRRGMPALPALPRVELPDLPWSRIGAAVAGVVLIAGLVIWGVSALAGAKQPAAGPPVAAHSPSPGGSAKASPSPGGIPTFAPAASGAVSSVQITPQGACTVGSSCALEVSVHFQSGQAQTIAWDFEIVDSCTSEATQQKGTSVNAQSDWNNVIGDTTLSLPAGHPLAIVAVTSQPSRAASSPLLLPGGPC